jgi:membrane fusion protein (multidrug efflux system)
VAAGGLLALTLLGGGIALVRNEGSASRQSTDDAYVQADYSTVAPKVRGLIAQLLVEDNQPVKRGQLLAIIDDRDFRVALMAAEADLASARAAEAGLRASLDRQAHVIAQASATVEADNATVSLSRANAARYKALASDGSASMQEQQETKSRLDADEAVHRRDVAAGGAAQEQIAIIQADLAHAQAATRRAEANVEAARLNLSYTRIVAPIDGTIGRRSVRVGNYVEVGAALLAVVPLDEAFVEANFRETQLRHVHPGQEATITVDTLPGIRLHGHVESIAPASGVTFAAIAPENGTGNFTKIVQRLPVKIKIDAGQPDTRALRVGMSVQPTVDTTS